MRLIRPNEELYELAVHICSFCGYEEITIEQIKSPELIEAKHKNDIQKAVLLLHSAGGYRVLKPFDPNRPGTHWYGFVTSENLAQENDLLCVSCHRLHPRLYKLAENETEARDWTNSAALCEYCSGYDIGNSSSNSLFVDKKE